MKIEECSLSFTFSIERLRKLWFDWHWCSMAVFILCQMSPCSEMFATTKSNQCYTWLTFSPQCKHKMSIICSNTDTLKILASADLWIQTLNITDSVMTLSHQDKQSTLIVIHDPSMHCPFVFSLCPFTKVGLDENFGKKNLQKSNNWYLV